MVDENEETRLHNHTGQNDFNTSPWEIIDEDM